MEQQTAEDIAQRIFDLGLLDERQLREVWAALGSSRRFRGGLRPIPRQPRVLDQLSGRALMKGDRTGYFFGKYRVLYLVGHGTFARVYRAAHRETGQIVAVKVLRNRFSENAVQASLFVREGRLGCVLRHPNIVPIYEVFSKGRNHFLVMEFVEGRNLREFIRHRKKIEPVEATRMMIGITDGLRYALEHGLTHRNLKVSNVLVSSRGQPKLVDFGLASIDENPLGRRPGQLVEHANSRLCGAGAGHRRPQGRFPQRHLFSRLHFLPHADRPAAAPRDP